MSGDISDGGNASAGGIIGVITDGGSFSIVSSINAMNGNVYNAVTGSSLGTLDVTVNQNFGLTFDVGILSSGPI